MKPLTLFIFCIPMLALAACAIAAFVTGHEWLGFILSVVAAAATPKMSFKAGNAP